MISVTDLKKSFGELLAVDNVSFSVARGEIYGLLGPNGAGKTTTLSMLGGLLAPDGGRLTIDDLEVTSQPIEVKSRLGIVPQETAVYEELTALENLRFWGALYGLVGKHLSQAVERVLDQVGLTERARDPVKTFSGGMKRRLNLSLGLIHRPLAILLDEPTVGIDPQGRLRILEVIREVADMGTAVLYTTHHLEEAEQLCDRIGIMDHGKILAEGSLAELTRLVGEQQVVTVEGGFDAESAESLAAELAGVEVITVQEGLLVVSTLGPGQEVVKVLQGILNADLSLESVAIQPPSLNGLFLKLTGRNLRD